MVCSFHLLREGACILILGSYTTSHWQHNSYGWARVVRQVLEHPANEPRSFGFWSYAIELPNTDTIIEFYFTSSLTLEYVVHLRQSIDHPATFYDVPSRSRHRTRSNMCWYYLSTSISSIRPTRLNRPLYDKAMVHVYQVTDLVIGSQLEGKQLPIRSVARTITYGSFAYRFFASWRW